MKFNVKSRYNGTEVEVTLHEDSRRKIKKISVLVGLYVTGYILIGRYADEINEFIENRFSK